MLKIHDFFVYVPKFSIFLNRCRLLDVAVIVDACSSNTLYLLISQELIMKLPSNECHSNSAEFRQYWFN